MSDWQRLEDDFLAEVSRRPAALPPSTLGQVWDAEWRRSGLDTIVGVGRPFTESYEELRRAIEEKGGGDIAALAYRNGVNLGAAATADDRVAALNALADTLPEEARKDIEPLRDVRRRAADKAQQIERDAADVMAGSVGLTGMATAFLAGTARQMLDPVNLGANIATAPLGGPVAGPVLRVVARQAAAGGLAQLAVEPYVQATRAELGLENGFAQGAANVAQSAIGAGGLTALFRAAAAGLRYARAPRAPAPTAETAAPFEPTFIGYMDAEDAAAFNRGEPLTTPHSLADIPDVPGFARNVDIAEAAGARPLRERRPDEPPVAFEPAFRGTLDPEDAGAFDRGEAVATPFSFAGLADLPGLPSRFDIAQGASARPVRTRAPEPPPQAFEPTFQGVMDPDDAAAFDRGGPVATVSPLGEAGFGFSGFEVPSVRDLEAAARFAEREQIVDAAAPPSWDRATHGAMVDEASAALEAGRPVDRAKVRGAVADAGLRPPELDAVPDNPVSQAVRPGQRFGVHRMDPDRRSLFQFLAAAGGLHPQDLRGVDSAGRPLDQARSGGGLQGEIRGIFDKVNPFIPGFGPLLRKAGRSLAQAQEIAEEAGYLPRGSSTDDFLRMVASEAAGDPQYKPGFERQAAADPAERAARMDEDRAAREGAFDARMAELQIVKLTKRDRKRALQIMEKEGIADPLLAYEQALAEHATRQEAIRAKRLQDQELHIPGWDVADDARAAPQDGEALPRQPGDRPGGGGPGGEPRPGREGAGAAGEQGRLGETLGDPALKADAERAIAAAGDDLEITIQLPDGTVRRGKPADLLKQAEEDAQAASELFDCIGVKPTKSEEPPF